MTRLRYALKNYVQSHPWAQRVYANWCGASARRHLSKGRHYLALKSACDALRRVPISIPRAEFAELLRKILAASSCGDTSHSADSRISRDSGYSGKTGDSLWRQFRQSRDAATAMDPLRREPVSNLTRLRKSKPNDSPRRQGHLVVLKAHDERTGERGVILLKYNVAFGQFAALFDLPRVSKNYRIVLEPSYAGPHETMFLWQGMGTEVFIQTPYAADFELFSQLGPGLVPLRMGAGDWVDTALFQPGIQQDADYDLVMVASWSPIKRHVLLFDALKKLRPRTPKVALIGYPLDWKRKDIEALAQRHGVLDQCTFFEAIPPEQVAPIVSSSRVSLFLSRQEGASKAVYESWACGTPVIINDANIGFNRADLCDRTGIAVSEAELARGIADMLDHRQSFAPRDWLLENSGAQRSTEKLNDVIRRSAVAAGEPWTRNLVIKTNRPNLMYLHDSDRLEMQAEFEQLSAYLLEYREHRDQLTADEAAPHEVLAADQGGMRG